VSEKRPCGAGGDGARPRLVEGSDRPRKRKRRRLIAILLLAAAALTAECGPRPLKGKLLGVAPEITDAAALTRQVQEKTAPARSLRASLYILREMHREWTGETDSVSLGGDALISDDNLFRLRLYKFIFNPLDMVIIEGQCEAYVHVPFKETTLYYGEVGGLSRSEKAKSGIQIPIELTGRRLFFPRLEPEAGETVRFSTDETNYLLEYRADPASEHPTRTIRVGKKYAVVREVKFYRPDGELAMTIIYDRYRLVPLERPEGGARPPSPGAGSEETRTEIPIPTRMKAIFDKKVNVSRKITTVEITVESLRLETEPLPADLFRLEVPKNVPREPLWKEESEDSPARRDE